MLMNQAKVNRLANRLAKIVESDCPEIYNCGAPGKKQLWRVLSRKIEVRHGRPRKPELDQAEALRAEGWSFSKILAFLRPGFHQLSTAEQMGHREKMRKAMNARRRRERTAKEAPKRKPPKK